MRVLLDESLPRRLAGALPGHHVVTVPQSGWASRKNGELLRRADAQFDVFVTPDCHLLEQQNVSGLRFCIVALRARSNAFADLLPLVQELSRRLADLAAGQILRLG